VNRRTERLGPRVDLGHLYVERLPHGTTVEEYSATLPDGWCAVQRTEGFYDLEQGDPPYEWRTDTEDRMEDIVVAHPQMSRKDAFLLAVLETVSWESSDG